MMILTQDGPCDFSTDDHQNSELHCQNVSAGSLLQPQDTSRKPRGNLSSSSAPYFSNT